MERILVTGATGHLGSAIITTLLKRISASRISVITRQPDKLADFESKGYKAFLGSYDNIKVLEKAMKGVDTVLLISSGDQGDRMQEHKNVIDAAKKTGVQRIAYTSRSLRERSSLANQLMEEHFQTEDYIKACGMAYTLFRNILYMDTIPQFIGGNLALEHGIYLPAGDGAVAFALRSEIGEAMANVLLTKDTENKIYNFTGNRSYTFYDIASALSELSGNTVNYSNVEENEFKVMMKQRNVPEPVIEKIVNFITDIKHNQEADVYPDIETSLGRKPVSLKEGLRILFGF